MTKKQEQTREQMEKTKDDAEMKSKPNPTRTQQWGQTNTTEIKRKQETIPRTNGKEDRGQNQTETQVESY
jgi:hypothetical protein